MQSADSMSDDCHAGPRDDAVLSESGYVAVSGEDEAENRLIGTRTRDWSSADCSLVQEHMSEERISVSV